MKRQSYIYKVNEIFYSLQGEGRWTGRAAIFVRFAKCNLRCSFCDTAFDAYTEMTAEDVIERLGAFGPCKFVVLTGGEPTLQVNSALLRVLHENGYYVAMETNGTQPIPDGVDWVTCSPKTAFVKGAHVCIKKANEVKVVFDAEHEVSDYGIEAEVYSVQPCDVGNDARNKEILQGAIDYVLAHPKWQLSLQVHKIINVQ